MDAQELRNLQEAYMEVVENLQLDEEKKPLPTSKMSKQARRKAFRAGRELSKPVVDKYDSAKKDARQSFVMSRVGGSKVAQHVDKGYQQGKKRALKKEQVDIYDIILSHLLDEGYAETPEAAEAIMVNMSEEWRDSIIG